MSLNDDQQKELACFPPALQALISAELAAGNAVVEIGHSFPAPPAGAFVKLTNKVSTRARSSGDGLQFYERSGSLYSGEFTDAKRFYFVLEPANPPPPEPDMDAIRKALQPLPHTTADLAPKRKPKPRAKSRPKRPADLPDPPAPATHALTSVRTDTATTHLLHFRDERAPHEIQFALEGRLMTLFAKSMQNGQLRLTTEANVVGGKYTFELRFEAALPRTNCYSLRVATSWAEAHQDHHDYYRKTADSWFKFWTSGFTPADPPAETEGSPERYRALSDAALHAEDHLDSVPALQKAVTAAMKKGAYFVTSHKEGGTHLRWQIDRFTRSDHGDDPDHRVYADEATFLTALRQFYNSEVSKNVYPNEVPDAVAWKLILRLLTWPN